MMAIANVLILAVLVIWILSWDDARPHATYDADVIDLARARRRRERARRRRQGFHDDLGPRRRA